MSRRFIGAILLKKNQKRHPSKRLTNGITNPGSRAQLLVARGLE